MNILLLLYLYMEKRNILLSRENVKKIVLVQRTIHRNVTVQYQELKLQNLAPLDSSDCCAQTIWAEAQRLSFSPLVCRLRKSSEVSYLLTWARAWNPNFSPRNISYVPRRFENIFRASTLNRLTELSRSYQNVYVWCSQYPQTTFGVQHTEWCIKDISFLLSA